MLHNIGRVSLVSCKVAAGVGLLCCLAVLTTNVRSQSFSAHAPPQPNVLGPDPTGAIILVPLPSFGASFASANAINGIETKNGFSYSLGLAAAFYLLRTMKVAPVLEVAYESRAATFSGADGFSSNLRTNYLSFEPGVQLFHFFTLVLNVGLPVGAVTTTALSRNMDVVTSLPLSGLNPLIEGRVVLAYPLFKVDMPRSIWIGFVSFTYPFQNIFREKFELLDEVGVSHGSIQHLRLPSIQFGVSLAFAQYVRYPS